MPIDKQLLRQLLATEKFKKCADSPDSAAELGSTLVSVKAEDGLKRQRRYEILILEKS